MVSEEVQNSRDKQSGTNPNTSDEIPGIVIHEKLYSELIQNCLDALPDKAYGLVGGADLYHPKTLYPCSTNLRNTPEWSAIFDSFGDFHRNPDMGFVIAPSEVKIMMDRMISRKERLVGVYHSHRYLGAEPSIADIGLSSESELFNYIVSVANPPSVEVGIFSLKENSYRNIPIIRI